MAEIHDQLEDPGGSDPDASLAGIEELERKNYRSLCLERLRALVTLRARLTGEGDEDAELHRHLADHALYSVYRDCLGVGAAREARRLIEAGGMLDTSSPD